MFRQWEFPIKMTYDLDIGLSYLFFGFIGLHSIAAKYKNKCFSIEGKFYKIIYPLLYTI